MLWSKQLLLMGLAAALIGWAPQPASAQTPTVGDVVYVGSPSGDVYLLPADGSPVRRLTTQGGAGNVAWSPDGKTLAYDRGGDIWTLVPGSHARRLTFNGSSSNPTWSPDGRTIAYGRRVAAGLTDIFLVPTAGGSSTRLSWASRSGCSAGQPSWQVRGGLIAYVRSNPGNGHCTAGIVTQQLGSNGHLRIADPSVGAPAFTRDGKHLLYLALCDPELCMPGSLGVWEATAGGAARHMVPDQLLCAEGELCLSGMVRSPVAGWITSGTYGDPDTGAVFTCFQGGVEDAEGDGVQVAPQVCVPTLTSSFDVRLAR